MVCRCGYLILNVLRKHYSYEQIVALLIKISRTTGNVFYKRKTWRKLTITERAYYFHCYCLSFYNELQTKKRRRRRTRRGVTRGHLVSDYSFSRATEQGAATRDVGHAANLT